MVTSHPPIIIKCPSHITPKFLHLTQERNIGSLEMHVATTVLQLFKILSLSQSSSMNVPTFPLLGFDMIIIMGYLHCFLSSAISSVIFNFFMSSSTTLLQVVLAYLSSLLSQVCYSHPYVLLDQPISTLFYLICVKCSPHHISSHLLVILSYHLTLDMYLNIL